VLAVQQPGGGPRPLMPPPPADSVPYGYQWQPPTQVYSGQMVAHPSDQYTADGRNEPVYMSYGHPDAAYGGPPAFREGHYGPPHDGGPRSRLQPAIIYRNGEM
jgi:hypothetical protein